MHKIIKAAVDRGASDLHIKAGDVLRARIDGKLVAMTRQALTPDQTRAIALQLIKDEDIKKRIDSILDYDCGWGAEGVGRFRVNILRQRSSFMIVMRVIPLQVPTIDGLDLPDVLSRIALAERGMVLVTGVTGSGKSSTLAALINQVNTHQHKHIITLEEPIEFIHRDVQSSVTQREIGVDTDTFKNGLKAALRQDPDVIVIGEMRDTDTIDTAMKAAETGHLLMSTLHTPDAQTTIVRMISMFPPEEQEAVRMRLAESLQAVVSQRLLPRADGTGRVVAAEVMVATPTIRELMLDGNRVGEIKDYIRDGQAYGMQTFDQHLSMLVNKGVVAYEVALAAASNPSDFELHHSLRRNTAGMRQVSFAPPAPAAAAPAKAPANGALEGLQPGAAISYRN